jgi:hypothetical protein
MYKFVLFLFFVLLSVQITAQEISFNPNPPTVASEQVNNPYYPDAVTITQSTDPVTITTGNSVSCNAGGLHANNSYFRAFTLSTFGINNLFNVSSVQIGIEQASSTNATQQVTCNLYAGAGGFPTGYPGSFTLIGTVTADIAPQNLTLYTFNVAGSVPAGQQLVVEIFTPDGQTLGNGFYIGSNTAGQSGPSYIQAADCGLTTPGDLAGIGFPTMHIVMSVTGDEIVPVELTSFTANADKNGVNLNWSTATETNNSGFQIERKTGNEFEVLGFIAGNGTSTEIHNYSYFDKNVNAGKYSYRLKQIDFNGEFEYSKAVEVVVVVKDFSLLQNFPNPFNPSTKINFSLAVDSKVKLNIYNLLGEQVAQLLNSNLTAGNHDVVFDATNLNSGVYFYKLEANGIDGQAFTSTKKMILTK